MFRHLNYICSLVTVVLCAAATILFYQRGYSGIVSARSYNLVVVLLLSCMVKLTVGALRGRKIPWLVLPYILLSLALAWPDFRGPRLFVRDVYGFELPASCSVLRDERHTETVLEFTISPADWEALRQHGVAGEKDWKFFDPNRFFGPIDGQHYKELLFVEFTNKKNHCLVGYDQSKQRLILVNMVK